MCHEPQNRPHTIAVPGTGVSVRVNRWFRALKPHVKVGLVAIVLIAGGVTVLGVSLNRLSVTAAPVQHAADRSIPALVELQRLSQGQEQINAKFNAMLTEPDPAARVIQLEDIRRQLSLNDEAWRRFRAASVGFPDEARLWDAYDKNMDTQKKLAGPVGLGIIGGAMERKDPGDLFADETFVELRRSQRGLQDAVDQLVNRYTPAIEQDAREAVSAADGGRSGVILAFSGVMVVSVGVALVSFRSARDNQRRAELTEMRRSEESRRNELEARLYRALQMARREEDAYKLVAQALTESLPEQPVELLMADSSASHFRQVVSTDAVGRGPGCPVVAPEDCPAALRGDTLVFADSTQLDACPYLRDRSDAACAAVCQPVSVAGKAIGVVHTTSPIGRDLPEFAIADLELIARRAGERIGLIRAFAESETQARTDPLTGLLNRRSLENSVSRLDADHVHYVIAFGDLDRFKRLNDSFGHDVGDRALRLFAKVLRDSIRPNDLACRYGGEEFVLVLPECGVDEAVEVADRVRTSLSEHLTGGELPPFTVSFGVASSTQAGSFERVVSLADVALMQSKASGRDRVTVSEGGRAALPAASRPELSAPAEF